MKKLIAMLLCVLMLLSLAACGAEEESNADLVITRGTEAAEETDAVEEGTEADQTVSDGPFVFVYEGVKLMPGQAFDDSILPEAESVTVVPSCALEGTDNLYNYGSFELTAMDDGYGEDIYSIYFIDPNLTTPEGLALADDESKIVELYGEDYEQDGSSYVYTRESTMLVIITQDGVVTSIEYRLVTE